MMVLQREVGLKFFIKVTSVSSIVSKQKEVLILQTLVFEIYDSLFHLPAINKLMKVYFLRNLTSYTLNPRKE